LLQLFDLYMQNFNFIDQCSFKYKCLASTTVVITMRF